jgi:hypothetical protein
MGCFAPMEVRDVESPKAEGRSEETFGDGMLSGHVMSLTSALFYAT